MKKHRGLSKTAPLGNRLWQYRKRMGFTQEEVAAILGHVTRDLISHFEHGRRMPSFTTALKLEIVYRVPVAFLFPEQYQRLKVRLREREERLRKQWDRHEAKGAV